MNSHNETTHLRKYLTGIIGNAPFGIITLSVNHEVGIINAQAIALLGFGKTKPSDVIDSDFKDIFIHSSLITNEYNRLLKSGGKLKSDLANIRIKKGRVNVHIRELFNGSLIILEDVTKESKLERQLHYQAKLECQLRYQASHDKLTNLSNRQDFEDCVNNYIPKSIKHKLPGAVIFIDLDRFKPINDIAGHSAGDELLKRVALILTSNVRERDVVARIGGDEFAVLLTDCPLPAAEKIAEAIRKAVDEMIFIAGENSFKLGISAGISCIDDDNNVLSTIINSADNACQIAKNQGRNRIHVASKDMDEYDMHKQQVAWLPRINKALENDDFTLFAQQISPINTSAKVKHFELLLRLVNDDGSLTSPAQFIPAAERYDLMPQVDQWVIEHAFKHIDKNTFYSINLSGLSTCDDNLAKFIESLHKIHHVDPAKITFEITETAAIQNIDKCLSLIAYLKRLGFKFSLDDFGSGLSSFSYLKNLNIDYLKIDGSFVKEIVNDSTSYAIVKSINEVGHTMGLQTIAEFVENEQILMKLKEIGVDYAQGYYIHKPQQLQIAEDDTDNNVAISSLQDKSEVLDEEIINVSLID